MYNKNIFNHLPVFVHTGVEHLHNFMNFCIENGFEWLGYKHATKANADFFADKFGEDIGLFLYEVDGRKSFLFDDTVGDQTEMCLRRRIDSIIEALDYSTEPKLDLSDIEKFF